MQRLRYQGLRTRSRPMQCSFQWKICLTMFSITLYQAVSASQMYSRIWPGSFSVLWNLAGRVFKVYATGYTAIFASSMVQVTHAQLPQMCVQLELGCAETSRTWQ